MRSKKQLAILLSQVEGFNLPKAGLEQYTSPSEVAAHVLHTAYMQGDIEGRYVADLGCGPGIFAIGASLLGAAKVYGVDIDVQAIEMAKRNAEKLGASVEWAPMAIEDFNQDVDTVLQNPPFGVQERHADRPFLEKALSIGKRVYSLHLSNPENRNFISSFVESLGGRILAVEALPFNLPPTLAYHTKERHDILVDLYILEGK